MFLANHEKLGQLNQSNMEVKAEKKRAFFLPSNIAAIKFADLDQCCCSDVPCLSILKEYCESSSLHGLKYISQDGRHWTERILWTILCICGFILTIYFIVPIWIKWSSQPTLTTLDSTNYPVWEIDFPAVTVCSPNKVIEDKLKALAQKSPWKEALGQRSFAELQKLFELAIKFKNPEMKDAFQDLQGITEAITTAQVTAALIEIMPNCTDYIKECWWQGEQEDCGSVFELRKTDEGFCCSFNALRQSETIDISSIRQDNDENSFSKGLKSFQEEFFDDTNEEIASLFDLLLNEGDLQPLDSEEKNASGLAHNLKTNVRRVNNANHNRGLTLLLNISSTDHFITTENFIGLKLLIHDPGAYPELQSKALAIGSGQEYFITTRASHTDASSRIRDFAISARNCLFDDEKNEPGSQVTMFKHYSEENCLLECRARHLVDTCGCLPYYYPRLDIFLDFDLSNVTTCSWDGLECLANNSDLLDSIRPSIYGKSPLNFGQLKGAKCRCPPACSKTRYTSTYSAAQFPNKISRYAGLEGVNDLSLVHVYFNDLKMVRYITDELFSWQDILASFGGLVGLCTGFSFLSAAEIVYFFTLRCSMPLCRKKRNNRLHAVDDDHLVMIKIEE